MPTNKKLPKRKHDPTTNSKSPFVKYSFTVVACVLIAAIGFTIITFSHPEDIQTDRTWNSGRAPYITANTTVSSVTPEPDYPDDEKKGDAAIDQPGSSGGSGSPALPGVGGITLNGNCYTDMQIASATSNTTLSGLPLYNGWPWGDTTVTMCNPEALLDQLITDIASSQGVDKSAVRCSTSISVDIDGNVSSSMLDCDGITCLPLCFYPAWISKDYYAASWSGQMPSWNASDADSVYACLVFADDNGNNWFLPIRQSDNKGHTFPGGVMQTFLRATSFSNNVYNVQVANTIDGNHPLAHVSGSYGPGTGDGAIWSGTMSQILGLYVDSSGYTLYYDSGLCKLHFSLETNSAFVGALRDVKSTYTLIGIAVVPK